MLRERVQCDTRLLRQARRHIKYNLCNLRRRVLQLLLRHAERDMPLYKVQGARLHSPNAHEQVGLVRMLQTFDYRPALGNQALRL